MVRSVEDLTFEQVVPRGIAHRTALGEVFITDSVEVSEAEFALGTQIPRAHSLWFDRPAHLHDPLSTAEAARQASFVVVHRHLDVSLGIPFSLQRFGFRVEDVAAYSDPGDRPLQGVLILRLAGRRQHGEAMGRMSFDGHLLLDDAKAMTFDGDIVFLPKDDYSDLRTVQRSKRPLDHGYLRRRPERLDAADVGRHDPRNVVLGPGGTEDHYLLVIDRTHPSYFDHDYDHVPGPLMVEGFRQAAVSVAGRRGLLSPGACVITGCSVDFRDFAEFEGALEYAAEVDSVPEHGRVVVALTLRQFDDQVARARVELCSSEITDLPSAAEPEER